MKNVSEVLLWCTVINYCLLILWWVILLLPHDWILRLCQTKNLQISKEKFDEINFKGIVFYKLAVVLFNLVPYIALRIVNGS